MIYIAFISERTYTGRVRYDMHVGTSIAIIHTYADVYLLMYNLVTLLQVTGPYFYY